MAPPEDETAPEPDNLNKRVVTIQYADDVETGRRGRTQRRDSNDDGMSIRSISRRYIVDPGTVLPAQYRTLSFGVEEAIAREKENTLKSESSLDADFTDVDWHKISVEDIIHRLGADSKQGLSDAEVAERLEEHGRNIMSRPKSRWFIKTLQYLYGGFGSILFMASILVFIAWKPLGQPPALANLALAIVLAIVWVIQALFSFFQDWSSSRVMASIKNMLPDDSIVIRNGAQQSIVSTEIVPGDILYIKMGDKLPADVRFIDVSSDVKFDRSILTGETVPLRGTVNSTDENFLETSCIGMAGTHCTVGTAHGLVFATGDNSVFGRLAKLTAASKIGLTNLEKEIYYFVGMIVAIMLTMIIVVLIVWGVWLRKAHPDWITVPVLIIDCVSVAVAFIPEGLPIAVTASLTIVAGIMKKNKILCKSLKTVETLGSVSTICSDKTGTLTKNQMVVTDCMIGTSAITANAATGIMELSRTATNQAVDFEVQCETLSELAFVAGICNAGEFDVTTLKLPLEQRKILGDATDQAVLRFAEGIQSVSDMRYEWRSVFRLPFNSKNKFMGNVVQPASTGLTEKQTMDPLSLMTLTIKGAPDILLPRCTRFLSNEGRMENLTDEYCGFIEKTKNTWSKQSKRVILMARKVLPGDMAVMSPDTIEFEDEVIRQSESELELIGLVGLIDPPREEIPEVVRILRGAGIKVHMVTGDFKLTAQAIAVQCGIITQPLESVHGVDALPGVNTPGFPMSMENLNSDAWSANINSIRSIVLSGSDLTTLDDVQWNALCKYDEIVFARTTPEQKLRIVKELQVRGEVVGMTGDGVNDAPSLKAADIGIAMGSGSDVAIEAADMVLLESFAAIVEAVKYGRVVFENLKKTICYLLPAGSFSEFWPVFSNVLFGLPQVLSSFLMIIICCFTDCAAATAIAFEKPEADVLLRKPRNPKKDHLINWKLILYAYGFIGILETVSSFAMSYWYAEQNGIPFRTLWFGFGSIPEGMSSDQYNSILNEASSVYFINLVVMQWFVLMAIRTRRRSILQQPPLFRKVSSNRYLLPAIIFALLIAVFFLYVPKFQTVLSTSAVPVAHWFLPMGFGMAILLLDEGRKYLVRGRPNCWFAKIAW